MAIEKLTTPPGYPQEIITLIQAFDACCQGASIKHTRAAAVEFLAIAIRCSAQANEIRSRDEIENFAKATCLAVVEAVLANVDRPPQQDDVEIRRN